MLQAFVIVLREGFEAFLIVSIIVSYIKRMGRNWLLPAVVWGIAISLLLSGILGFVMSKGVNEPLWEGILGLAAAVMVTTLVIQMWKQGTQMKRRVEKKLEDFSHAGSKKPVFLGTFLFTLFMISREGMEMALMLIQVPQRQVFLGVFAGLAVMAVFSWLWTRFSSRINVKLFFQVTGVFLLLFVAQILIYSFHEFAESGLIPNSEAFHAATEPFSPEGVYGKWFAVVTVAVSALWLLVGWWKSSDRSA